MSRLYWKNDAGDGAPGISFILTNIMNPVIRRVTEVRSAPCTSRAPGPIIPFPSVFTGTVGWYSLHGVEQALLLSPVLQGYFRAVAWYSGLQPGRYRRSCRTGGQSSGDRCFPAAGIFKLLRHLFL